MSDKIVKLKADICELTMLEVAELVDLLNEEFGGVLQLGGGAVAAPVAGVSAADSEAEAKTEFDLVWKEEGTSVANKVSLIKEMKSLLSISLSEAKSKVEGLMSGTDKNIVKAVPKDEADKLKKALEGLGVKSDIE